MSVSPYTPISADRKQLARDEFAARLQTAMDAKGWSQSDLARRCFGTVKDSRGYNAAKGRDRISAYLNGISLPEKRTVKQLAAALGVKPDELLPPPVPERPQVVPTGPQVVRIEMVRKRDLADIIADLKARGLSVTAQPMELDASAYLVEVK
jgi:transcriptional regulator with XRE-family HTH domain